MATWQDVKDAALANDMAWDKVNSKLADMQAKLDSMPMDVPSAEDYQALVDELKSHVTDAQDAASEAPAVPVDEAPVS